MLGIMITNGPEDVTVTEGATAMFPCWIRGTNSLPFWYINGSVYMENLPPRHYYVHSNRTLVVMDVQLSDNGTTYRCSLVVVSSNVGVLTVDVAQPGEKNHANVVILCVF